DAPAPPIEIHRAAGPISIDGDLSDEGWKGAARVDTWYETNPGDNTPPKVKNVGYLTYDDKFFYAGFEFQDPQPAKIRAPLGDRDNLSGTTDYGGVLLDTRNDGKTGILFVANPRSIQYDSVLDDPSGNEDSSPDYYWDAKVRITSDGWMLEIRIPFSSLRYARADPRTWRIMLYRNYPRDYRYQFFTVKLPRGGSCFVCRSASITGLEGLPSGGHLVLAPYATGREAGAATDGPGTPWHDEKVKGDAGLDLKWTPTASTAVDATVNPDFSQIESDVAQIGVNERFALFYSEKRPFFLEGSELFSTPIQAVYTRTVTAPRWGVRGTGKFGSTAYTALLAEDDGGGSVILPGSNSSDLAADDRLVPPVGYRRTDLEGGYTFRPNGFLRRLRTFYSFARSTDRDGGLLNRRLSVGTGMDGKWSSFFRFWYAFVRVRAGTVTLPRQQLLYIVQLSPSLRFNQIGVDGFVGEEIDFDGARTGRGANVNFNATFRPTNHLEL